MQGATMMAGPAPAMPPIDVQLRRARGALNAMHAASPVAIDGPTPERVRHAGADFEVSSAIRSVEVVKSGRPQTEQIRTPRARVGEDPFTRLIQRGELDPECEVVNTTLGAAGLRYRRLRERAGSAGIKAQDLTRGFSTAGTPSDVLDTMLDNWSGWDKARAAVAPEMRPALDGVVLDGRKLDDVGGGLSRYTDPKRRSLVALTALRFALSALDRHFAAVDANAPDHASA